MRHIIIHYADAFTDFASIGDDRHFFIDGRWSQRRIRVEMIKDAEMANLRATQHGWPPVYATGYTVLGENDNNTLHPMPYVTARNHSRSMRMYGHDVLLMRTLGQDTEVFIDGVLRATYHLEQVDGGKVIAWIHPQGELSADSLSVTSTLSAAPYAVTEVLTGGWGK